MGTIEMISYDCVDNDPDMIDMLGNFYFLSNVMSFTNKFNDEFIDYEFAQNSIKANIIKSIPEYSRGMINPNKSILNMSGLHNDRIVLTSQIQL